MTTEIQSGHRTLNDGLATPTNSAKLIIESPEHTQEHKKRPRLVTSCDNCRLKKIRSSVSKPLQKQNVKLVQLPKFPVASVIANVILLSEAVPLLVPVSHPTINATPNPSLDGYSVASVPSSRPTSSSLRYTPYGSDTRRSVNYSHRASYSGSSARQSPLSYGSVPSPAHMMLHHSWSSSGPRQNSIFGPEYSQSPNPQFMSQFIQSFFQHLGSEYPFIKYEDVAGDFMERRMSVALSNSIAALAVQYSVLPELTVRGLHNVAEAYAQCARVGFMISSSAPGY
ncbi:hypothetical protein VKT23_019324 [Stygiomarasmius scandens]|uniref:Uncharacterized protein n=1 Tax=Marasmiellus scandens TaxID=2682957 RepID=A0ABR1INY3_9AGAR